MRSAEVREVEGGGERRCENENTTTTNIHISLTSPSSLRSPLLPQAPGSYATKAGGSPFNGLDQLPGRNMRVVTIYADIVYIKFTCAVTHLYLASLKVSTTYRFNIEILSKLLV